MFGINQLNQLLMFRIIIPGSWGTPTNHLVYLRCKRNWKEETTATKKNQLAIVECSLQNQTKLDSELNMNFAQRVKPLDTIWFLIPAQTGIQKKCLFLRKEKDLSSGRNRIGRGKIDSTNTWLQAGIKSATKMVGFEGLTTLLCHSYSQYARKKKRARIQTENERCHKSV